MDTTPSSVLNGSPRLGILGGGQLGKMLAQAAADWHFPIHILDRNRSFPAAPYATNFVEGNFRDSEDVLAFGRPLDVLTIEIEHIHTGALRQLLEEGKTVHPHPDVLDVIKDKGRQKQFYQQHGLPTAPFELFPAAEAIREAVSTGRWPLPFVQKARTGGYDGRGVAVIRTEEELQKKLLPVPSLLEELVPFSQELAVIVARNQRDEQVAFPVVSMEFNEEANLVEFIRCPAPIDPEIADRATALALRTARAFKLSGLLAVELFLTADGELLINEVAPRPHNSGHHTIEACLTSQFQQHLRGVLNLPLGPTDLLRPAVMLNILGAPHQNGPVDYSPLAPLWREPGVYLHLYGKAQTKPFRKMGHITVLGETEAEAYARAKQLQEHCWTRAIRH